MSKFYPLTKPEKHINAWGYPIYRVEADPDDSSSNMYLHNDGMVKWGTICIAGILSLADFASLDEAYLAINNYYVKFLYKPPFVRGSHGNWLVYNPFDIGQPAESVVDSVKSEPMEF